MQLALDHLHLKSHDPEVAARFYIDGFGAAEVSRVPGRRIVIALFGLRIFIDHAPAGCAEAAQMPSRGLEHLAIRTDSPEALLQRLADCGGRTVSDLQLIAPGVHAAFITAPDGETIEILQREAV